MLRKYIANPDVVVEYEPSENPGGINLRGGTSKIMDRKEQVLRTKTIPIVKVL
jgi:hypothetical protein